jgi:FtsZ-binding cell division protein ZapB
MTRGRQVFILAIATAAGVFAASTAVRSRSGRSPVDPPREQAEARRDPVDGAGVQSTAPTVVGPPPDVAPVRVQVSAVRDAAREAVAAPPPAPASAEVDRFQAELEELRKELAAVERENARARAEREALRHLSEQLDGIRGDLAQRAARSDAEAAAARQATAEREQAMELLVAAERRLAVGDTQALDLLDQTAGALPFTAQRAVQNARGAIESEDLGLARYWISVAFLQTQEALSHP